MNMSRVTALELTSSIERRIPHPGVDVGVAPPFVYIEAVAREAAGSALLVGAQDCHHEKTGAYTGEVSVDMLKDVGARFCLAGHSERRHVFHESPEFVAKKAAAIYAGGLILIHCVGEKLAEREANKTLDVVEAQLGELDPSKITDPVRLVIAYEPVWAIGTGRNATDAQAQEVHAYIRQSIARRWNKDFADRVRIQYGGSMKPENAGGLMRQPDVDGGLIGGAALKADSFLPIVQAAVAK